MDKNEIITMFWNDVAKQNAEELRAYFMPDAYIQWNNSNERFTVEEFIIANCEYPGDWCAEVERVEMIGNLAITVARVWAVDHSVSFHVTSFFDFQGDKIMALNEYWGEDGLAPQWRLDKGIGTAIKAVQ